MWFFVGFDCQKKKTKSKNWQWIYLKLYTHELFNRTVTFSIFYSSILVPVIWATNLGFIFSFYVHNITTIILRYDFQAFKVYLYK